jgi:hypothetical protein
MMNGGPMMWAMGLTSLLLVALLALGAAALVKYLLFKNSDSQYSAVR